MTEVTEATVSTRPVRTTDLELARLHLRLGALALARAELEAMAGRDALDDDGLVDLAEVRWRTGDIAGAGEAAHAVLRDEEGPLLALVVAAEAAMARGRPTEARRLAIKALAASGGTIDRVFAGMPRAAVWPADPVALPHASPTLFDVPAIVPGWNAPGPTADALVDPGEPARSLHELPSIGLWDDPDAASTGDDPAADLTLPSPEQALEAGRYALAHGHRPEAAAHLALVLRLAPALAPAILELVADDRDPAVAFVRGDAYRLVGRELEARRAFADAARSLAPAMTSVTPSAPTSQGDPA